MGFNQPAQGKRARLPRTVRPAFYACVIGVGLSRMFYPQASAGATSCDRHAKIAVINETPIDVTARAAKADDLSVRFIPGADLELSERSIERLLRLLDRVAERKRLERSATQ